MRTNRYLEDTVRTAPPQTLLLMIYDRLVLDLRTAIEAMGPGGDLPAARDRIEHAQAIILELRGTLKLDGWPEGQGLASLYEWAYRECSDAWMRYDVRKVRDVHDVVLPLRDTWREAAAMLSPERVLLTTQVV